MSLTAADVAEIMRLVEQSSFDELTLEMEGIKLCLRRGGAVGAGATHGAVSHVSSASHGAAAGTPSVDAGSAAGAAQATGSGPVASGGGSAGVTRLGESDALVTAPLLGTFYRSPKPGAPPFVEPGDEVQEDTIVAIIEVMKLMNTVRAGVRGTVTEVLAKDGALVEYDEALLRIRKAG